MKKFLKISGITVLIILLVLISLPFLFKGKIIKAVKDEANKSLNAKLNFSDDIGIGIFKNFPKLSIGLKEVSIVGIDTFKNDTLAYLPEISVSLNIMSVIKGDKMEINSIRLLKPRLHLWVLQNGKANWDISKPDSTATDTGASTFKMALEKLEIIQGDLVYEDQSLPFYTALKQFDHTLKGDFTLDRFLMETQTKAAEFTLGYGGVNYIYKAAAEILVNLDMDMKEMKFAFKDNEITLNQLQLGGEGFVDMNENDMDFDIVFKTKKTDFKTIMSMVPGMYSKSFGNAKASGKLDFGGYLKGKMTNDKMPGFGIKLNIDNGYFQYPDLPKSLQHIFVNLSVDNPTGISDHTVIDLKRFDADIAGEHVYANLLMKTPESNLFTRGAFKGKVNLSEFRSFIPLEKSTEISGLIKGDVQFDGFVSSLQNGNGEGFSASGTLAAEKFHYKDAETLPQGTDLDMTLNFNPAAVVLENCKGVIGMSDFDLKGQLDNLFGYMMKDELLKGNFTFHSNYLNANEFLSDEEVKKEPAATDSIPLQAFEVPANLDFVLSSNVNTLIYDNLKLTDLAGKVILRDQQMFFEKLGVNVLGGSMSLNGVYESKNPKFPFSNIDFDIRSLDIVQTFNYFDMVQKMMPIAKYTQGLFNADIHLANHYNPDLSVSYPTVSGDLKVGIAEAAVKNFPLLNMIADQLKMDKLKNLTLKNLNLKLNILNGKVALDPLDLPLWTGAKANISGYTALDQSIKYIARMTIPRKDFGVANTALDNLSAQAAQKGLKLNLSETVDIDVLIGGFFNKPEVKISLHDVKNKMADQLKDQLNDEVEKQKKAVLDEANRRYEAAKKKTQDSLNAVKKQAEDRINAEKKALEEKAAEEKRKAEEKIKQEAEKKAAEEKKKALDKIKGGILK